MQKNRFNPQEVAKWLHETDDESFAETFVYLDSYSRKKLNAPEVTGEDMRHFDLASAVKFLGDALEEIVFSPEINEGAWWKKGVA